MTCTYHPRDNDDAEDWVSFECDACGIDMDFSYYEWMKGIAEVCPNCGHEEEKQFLL